MHNETESALLVAHRLTIGYGPRRAPHRQRQRQRQKRTLLVHDLNVRLTAGTLGALVGANGSGKTTLLRTLAGLLPRLAGEIYIQGRPLHRLTPTSRALMVALVSTNSRAPVGMTLYELVALGRIPHIGQWGRLWGHLQPYDRDIVMQALAATAIARYADERADRVSDGQLRRAHIAAALAQETPVLLLDEPTAFLDADGRVAIFTLLRRLADEERRAVLIATHEIALAKRYADQILRLG